MILAVRVYLPTGLALYIVPRALHMHEAQETQIRRKPDYGEQRSDLIVKTIPSPGSFRSEEKRQEQSRLLQKQTPCRPLEVSDAIEAQPTPLNGSQAAAQEDCGLTAEQVL